MDKRINLIKELILNRITFTIEEYDGKFVEMYAGYNQEELRNILDKYSLDYQFAYGRYWWKLQKGGKP